MHLHKSHVDFVYIWSLLSVNFDVYKMSVHDFSNLEFRKEMKELRYVIFSFFLQLFCNAVECC